MDRMFRYALPDTPVAGAAVDIGHLGIRIDLVLTGDLDVVGRVTGSTVDSAAATGDAVRACALTALRGMASGVMVRGLGSAAPALTSTAGHVFTQQRHDFPATGGVAFAGRCAIDFGEHCDLAEVSVRGTAGYSLEVTTNGRAGSASGFVQHDGELASIGMVVLVAVPIAPARLVAGEGG
ncbi:MAG: hypothetical protein GEV28_32100 [Actinophytocola sp.]|uniref:hypothetical protein n=1 Tax=Actinophytocola sp. TaxID=1872138 RepID=UPI00132309AD|nr:hypothetical protein [Actinophytocola sp.]MPZ84777.1 hypothetical protein [Actinophytocola sp.]